MKRIFISLLVGSTLILGGCFGGGSSDTGGVEVLSPENFATFDNKTVSVQYPVNWKLVSGSQVPTDKQGAIIAYMTSNFKDPFFTPTITISQSAVSEGTGVIAFAESNIATNQTELVSYEELERKDLTTYIGANVVNTKLVRFRGKDGLDGQLIEFIQTYLVDDGVGYTATAAYSPDDEDSEAVKIVQSLNTFRLK
jgi:hypothetical protein